MTAGSAYVGLAAPGDAGSWQTENKVILKYYGMLIIFSYMQNFNVYLCLQHMYRDINSGHKLMMRGTSYSKMSELVTTTCMLGYQDSLVIINTNSSSTSDQV